MMHDDEETRESEKGENGERLRGTDYKREWEKIERDRDRENGREETIERRARTSSLRSAVAGGTFNFYVHCFLLHSGQLGSHSGALFWRHGGQLAFVLRVLRMGSVPQTPAVRRGVPLRPGGMSKAAAARRTV